MINRLAIKQILPYLPGLLLLNLLFAFAFWRLDRSGAGNLDGSYSEAGSMYILNRC